MRIFLLALLAACFASACTPPGGTANLPATAAPGAPPTAVDARTSASPVGAGAITYGCDDGRTPSVVYGADHATLHLGGEPGWRLPRAESASTPGVEVYVGRNVALQREGDSIQLELSGASLRCWPVAQ